MRPFVLLLSSALFSAAHAQAQSEIRIGSASPLSGPGAHLGKDIENEVGVFVTLDLASDLDNASLHADIPKQVLKETGLGL